MKESNNEQYVYLLVERTLSRNNTALAYGVLPFNTLDGVNDTVLDLLTKDAKFNKGDVDYVSYTPHNNIDKAECGRIPCGKIAFKSGIEKTYEVLLRKIR